MNDPPDVLALALPRGRIVVAAHGNEDLRARPLDAPAAATLVELLTRALSPAEARVFWQAVAQRPRVDDAPAA